MKDKIEDVYLDGFGTNDPKQYAVVTHKITDVNHRGLKLFKPIVVTSINGSEFVEIRVPSLEEFK